MRKLMLPFVLAANVSIAAPAFAQESGPQTPVEAPTTPVVAPDAKPPQSTVHDRVVLLLSGYEYFPTRADLDQVAKPAEITPILHALALNLDERPSLRIRAVDALGYYDDPETVKLLETLVGEEPKIDLPRQKLRTAGLLRHHAITSLAKVKKGEAVPALEAVIAAGNLQLTLTAIHALGKHAGEEGRVVLTKLRDESQHKTVRREAAKWVK